MRQDANGTTMRQTIYTHVVGTSEPASYTWTWGAAQAAAGGILAYGGREHGHTGERVRSAGERVGDLGHGTLHQPTRRPVS